MTQIALVRFQVWDHDPIGQNFIGQRTIAFVSMMPGYRHVYLEGMEEASIFVHVAVNDITGKVKPSNAVKGFLKKATKKGSAKEPKTVSMHLSTYSSEDVRQRYRKDLDSYSQESSGNGSMLLTPAGIDYLHRGTQSEPLKRAHTVQILEEEIQGASPKEEKKKEGKRKGILVRMSSTFSNTGASIPCITATSPDLEDVFQSSQPQSPEPESQMQSFQAAWPDLEDQVQSFHAHWLGQDNSGRSFEPEWPDPPEIEDIAGEPLTKLNSKPALQTVSEHLNQPQPQLHPQPQSLPQAQPQSLPQAQPQSLPQAQPQSHPEVILRNRHPPSSPARVR
uniref:Uncharacterized protein n=2 Tax=Salmo trutta TaxID=8032 RepID=A0A674EL95_SALTR